MCSPWPRCGARFDLGIADYRNALAMTQDAEGRKLIGEWLAQLGAAV